MQFHNPNIAFVMKKLHWYKQNTHIDAIAIDGKVIGIGITF